MLWRTNKDPMPAQEYLAEELSVGKEHGVGQLGPWVGLLGLLCLVLSALWLRVQTDLRYAPDRRAELQLRSLQVMQDPALRQWLNGPEVKSYEVQNVADAWVALLREHPNLPTMPPKRLSQIDGARLTVHYGDEVGDAHAKAHLEQADTFMGVSSVWSDLSGHDAWSSRAQQHRWQSLAFALLALGLTLLVSRWVWIQQKIPFKEASRALVQLGVSQKAIDARISRMLGLRVAKAACLTIGLSWLCLAGYWVYLQQIGDEHDEQELVFEPRSLQIPEASAYPCDRACQEHQPTKATHEYIVDHKLGLLSRQDRALARHEQELRPWIWSLTRHPAHPAQRAVLGANLVSPELEAHFAAWKVQDAAFSRSLREIGRLARRLMPDDESEEPQRVHSPVPVDHLEGCQPQGTPFKPRSLRPFVEGKVRHEDASPRLEGLREHAMVMDASRGEPVTSAVSGQVVAILRDEPGRWTLLIDAGEDWIWGLSGITALEVQSGDEVRVGERLGEIARPAALDEGACALRVELWHGSRRLDPKSCFVPRRKTSRKTKSKTKSKTKRKSKRKTSKKSKTSRKSGRYTSRR